MPPMRPLTILHTECSDGWGGQEIRTVRESQGMQRRGHRLVIAAPARSMIYKRALEAGFTVYDFEFSKKNPLSFMRMRTILKQEKVDVLNTHSSRDSWVAGIAARYPTRLARIIRTRHLSTPIGKTPLSRFIYNTVPDAIMTTGEEIRRMMVQDNGYDGGKIFSVPTGTDLAVFDPENVAPTLETGGFSVGMLSVLRSWKGHEYFIRAVPIILKAVPDASFYIAGDGPQRDNIARLIDEMSIKDRVVMLGHREDVAGILMSLDVVVHPSYANEGVPQGVLQALAMKRPVVASDAGATREVVIDGETGFLIRPRSPEEIAEKVIELYRNPSVGESFARRGRALVEAGHSLERMLDKIEGIYGSILGNNV